jgi:hypothetical protein
MNKKKVLAQLKKKDKSFKSSLLSVREDSEEDNYSKMEIENSEEDLSDEEFLDTRKRAVTISTLNVRSPLKRPKKKTRMSAKYTKCSPLFSAQKKFDKDSYEQDVYFDNTLQKLKDFKIKGNLKNSEITPKLRAKMMDWMVEVLKLYNQREETIYRAFYLLDLYLQKKNIPVSYLHLIGTTCIMIASKNEEVRFIPISVILEKITYQKFTKEDLLAAELEILLTINFRVNHPNLYDVCCCAFNLLDLKEDKIISFLKNSTHLITKMCLFSYEIMQKFGYNEIASLAIILVLKLIENLHPGRNFDKLIKKVVEKFNVKKEYLIENLDFLKDFVFNFDSNFTFIRNLKRFYTFSF